MVNIEQDFRLRLLNENPSQANVYGFILFTEEHHNMVAIMRDLDFWGALDRLSGKPNNGWPIFSVYPLERKIEEFEGSGPNGTIGWMRCVSRETEYNQNALDFFGLKDSVRDLPCFVLFAIDQNTMDKVYQKNFAINGKTKDELKESLKAIVRTVTDIETNIRKYGTDKERTSPFAAWEASKSLEQLEVGSFIRDSLPIVGAVARFAISVGRAIGLK